MLVVSENLFYMKKILVPVSFSKASKNSLRHAAALYDKARITLLHSYPTKNYNKKYEFGKQDYAAGVRDKLWEFYLRHVNNPKHKIPLMTQAGTISGIVGKVSDRYDLIVMSRKAHPSKKHGHFSEKKLSVTTRARCPVLIMPDTDMPFNFTDCEHVWHIERRASESPVVEKYSKKLDINPAKAEVKTLRQTGFLSAFWKNIMAYEKSHDERLIKKIDKAHEREPIDLLILVDTEQSVFSEFFRSDTVRLFCKYNIPILVLPAS